MAELKDRAQDSVFTPELGGSIFINNTSYSGADIKIVVNIYDKGKSAHQKSKELQDELSKVQAELDRTLSSVNIFQSKVQSSKPGTSDFTLASSFSNKFRTEAIFLQERLNTLQDQIKSLSKSDASVSTKVLAEAQTLSISTHRDKQTVRSFGTVYPKAFTRGPRMIAGSIIFTVFDEHVLYRFLEAHASDFDATAFTSVLLDQLPPVDITVSFANEYGSISRLGIYGVEFVDEGQTMSIEDIMTENTVNWIARDIDPMRSVSSRFNKLDSSSAEIGAIQPKKASDLILEEDYQAIKDSLSPFARFNRRRNPFL